MANPTQLDKQLIQAIQLCENGQANKAEKILKKFSKRNGNNGAIANRYLAIIGTQNQQHSDAIKHMCKAVSLQSSNPQFQFELGLVYKNANKINEAISAYQKAISLNPEFFQAHFNLANLFNQHGAIEQAIDHYQYALRHKTDYHAAFVNLCVMLDLQQVYDLLRETCEHYKKINPNFVYIDYFQGRLFHQKNKLEEAINAYNIALKKRPDLTDALLQRASALHQLQRDQEAYQDLQQLINKQPSAAAFHLLGTLHHQQRDLEQAKTCYQEALKLAPQRVDTLCNLAEILEKTNHYSEAESVIDQALNLSPEHTLATRIKATLLRHRKAYADAIEILEKLPQQEEVQNALNLHFELGQLYDKNQKPETAFKHFQIANQHLEQISDVDAEKKRYLATIKRLEQQFTAPWLASWRDAATSIQNTPHFIVGFPRSGTTLTGQMFDSHPDIQVVEEDYPVLANIEKAVNQLPGGYPCALANLSQDEIAKLRQQYFELIEQRYSVADKQIIEKLPLNMLHTGLIYRLFPDAKFLLVLRHPLDACLSCFMQAFAPNGAMANFTSMAETIRFYNRSMQLWQQYNTLMRLDVHQIKYESLLDNQEQTMKTALQFLGLAWHQDVLNYANHARTNTISTPSYSQVIKPLYQSSRFRWQRYPQMKSYEKELQRWIEYYDYS